MKTKRTYDNSLIKLRFLGDGLENHSVPIYELGVCLIEIQRMIHKAHQVDSDEHVSKAYLSFNDRASLALQLTSRKKASDGYGLDTILTNPASAAAIGAYAAWILIALSKYVSRKVTSPAAPANRSQHVFNVFIYNQVRSLTSRINNIGGIQGIEISSSAAGSPRSAILDAETKQYVSELKDQVATGPIREITGTVIDFIPAEDAVIIKEPFGLQSKVLLSTKDFELLRYSEDKNPVAVFSGEPIYRLGVETYRYEALRGEIVRIIKPNES